jgi:hypothetical protein
MQVVFKGVEKFNQELDKIVPAIEKDWRGRAADILGLGVETLVKATRDTDSVDSGAYLISHAVHQLGGHIVYRNPDIDFGMDEDIPSQKQQGKRPIYNNPATFAEVQRAAMATLRTFERMEFINQRFYANQLEYGSHKITRPRMIYKTMLDQIAGISRGITNVRGWYKSVPVGERPK